MEPLIQRFEKRASNAFIRSTLIAVLISYLLWTAELLQQCTLLVVQRVSHLFGIKWLITLSRALPKESVINASQLLNPGSIMVGMCVLLAVPFLALNFMKEFIEASSVYKRAALSLCFCFGITMILMVFSFLDLVGEVMISGKAIKPFPQEAIGPLQYLNSLAFVTFCLISTGCVLLFTEISRKIWATNPYRPLPRSPRLIEFPLHRTRPSKAKVAANS